MENKAKKLSIVNTGESAYKPSVVMLLYGEGGVGKTTFTATAPKPLLADCENGAKYFGLRGIKMDVANIKDWSVMGEFYNMAIAGGYETVVIDPIGELMVKLKQSMIKKGERKYVQADGSPTMAGWGYMKSIMRDYIKLLKNSGLHVIFVAHVDEKGDEDRLVKRPYLETKLSTELINMVDIVGYMTTASDSEGESQRVIMVDPTSDKFVAKDRTGQLGKIIEPDFDKIIKACQGTETYAWSADNAVIDERKEEEKKAPEKNTKAKAKTKKKTKAKPKKKANQGKKLKPKVTVGKEYKEPEESVTEGECQCIGCGAEITTAVKAYSEKVMGEPLCHHCQKLSK